MESGWVFALIVFLFLVLLLILLKVLVINAPITKIARRMDGDVIIITGSSSGIGKVTAMELLEKGAKVIFACRNEQKTMGIINLIKNEKVRENAHFVKLDLTSFSSIENFIEYIDNNFKKIDILINNAGVMFNYCELTETNIELTLQTNNVGPLVLTQLLLPYMSKYSKIINIASKKYREVQFDQIRFSNDLDFTQLRRRYKWKYQYILSKLGNIFYTQKLKDYLIKNEMDIKTVCLHPGAVFTDIFYHFKGGIARIIIGFLTPFFWYFFKNKWAGSQTILHLCYINYELLNNGGYYRDCKESQLEQDKINDTKIDNFMQYLKALIKKNYQNIPKSLEAFLNFI
jgi:retinol dehydrogenase-13